MPESLITKQAIATGFKTLMEQKPFDKITILDITNTCCLNRQTFYYHFQDKYELVNWIFYQDVLSVLTKDLSLESWPDNLYLMLTAMYNNKTFYKNALKHSFEEEFTNYIYEISVALFCDVIKRISNNSVPAKELTSLSRFLSYGVVGSILTWVKEGMAKSPLELKDEIVFLVTTCKSYAVKQYLDAQGNHLP